MKKLTRYLVITASIAAVAKAAPFIAIGDGAELFATGVLGVRSDDNILLSKDSESDIIFDIAPGLELNFGKNAQTQGTVTLVDAFANYADNSRLNTNLFSGEAVVKYDDGKMKLGANAAYRELNQNTVDVRGLIRRDVTTGGVDGEVGVSEITAVTAAVNFNHENYHPSNYVDSDTLTVPVNFFYKWTPKIDVGLGYQYRDYQSKNGGAWDSTDNFYSVVSRGEFTPKLSGKLAVGLTERRFSSGQKTRRLAGVDAAFVYEFSPKTTAQIGAGQDFGTSPTGLQQKNLTGSVLVTTKLSEEWSVNGGAYFRSIKYDAFALNPDRRDDYWEATLGASYTVNAYVRLSATYVFRTYRSDLAYTEFDNNVFSAAATLRY